VAKRTGTRCPRGGALPALRGLQGHRTQRRVKELDVIGWCAPARRRTFVRNRARPKRRLGADGLDSRKSIRASGKTPGHEYAPAAHAKGPARRGERREGVPPDTEILELRRRSRGRRGRCLLYDLNSPAVLNEDFGPRRSPTVRVRLLRAPARVQPTLGVARVDAVEVPRTIAWGPRRQQNRS